MVRRARGLSVHLGRRRCTTIPRPHLRSRRKRATRVVLGVASVGRAWGRSRPRPTCNSIRGSRHASAAWRSDSRRAASCASVGRNLRPRTTPHWGAGPWPQGDRRNEPRGWSVPYTSRASASACRSLSPSSEGGSRGRSNAFPRVQIAGRRILGRAIA